MGAPETPPLPSRRPGRRRLGILLTAILLLALVAFAISRLNLPRIGHALITATPGWVALAFVLMGSSLVMRSFSWHQTLRAALPETVIRWPPVLRATMIGVMGSAVFPGGSGSPRACSCSRAVSRVPTAGCCRSSPARSSPRLSPTCWPWRSSPRSPSRASPSSTASSRVWGLRSSSPWRPPRWWCRAIPAGARATVAIGPRGARRGDGGTLLRLARGSGRLCAAPLRGGGGGLPAAGLGASVACLLLGPACPRPAVRGGLVAAAAILLAINVSAVLPATPSNVGVFQAACLVVLAAYGVGPARAWPTASSSRRSRC